MGADGFGPSLERICSLASSADVHNWAASSKTIRNRPGGTPGRRNDGFSASYPPVITNVQWDAPEARKKMSVRAEASGGQSISRVSLIYRFAQPRKAGPEVEVPMQRAGNMYRGEIEPLPPNVLVRFRIEATDAAGAKRIEPSPTEPRPNWSCSTYVNTNNASIPFAYLLTIPEPAPKSDEVSASEAPATRGGRPLVMLGNRGRDTTAFIYAPVSGGKALTFDYVQAPPRPGGKTLFLRHHDGCWPNFWRTRSITWPMCPRLWRSMCGFGATANRWAINC
jgi:hypothetical protein